MNSSPDSGHDMQRIASATRNRGFAHIQSSFFYETRFFNDLLKFQQSYFRLSRDTNGGRRYRAHRSLTLQHDTFVLDEPGTYQQSYDDNWEVKNQQRKFEPIEEALIQLELIQNMIRLDLEIARSLNELDFNKPVTVGLHQVRYAPIANELSVSSPPWLHKDTEPVVFIHMINLSENVIGGENIIAEDAKARQYTSMIRLNEPLETLLVTRKNFHAVVPIATASIFSAYRDILLLTFQN